MNQIPENQCYAISENLTLAIEFHLSDCNRRGFMAYQITDYIFEENPDALNDGDQAPEKLTINFVMDQVILLGWRLRGICDALRDGTLQSVRALPARYANLDENKPYVADVTMKPLTRE